ncbi:MAG: hypothetical protein MK116_11030 [Phycisphaerales bacterium]|nr:hypothetical protein [Phycisphaerales bacterium]
MPDRTPAMICLFCAVGVLPLACQQTVPRVESESNPALNVEAAEAVGPPLAAAPTEAGASMDPSSADGIAARARRDLLESMALQSTPEATAAAQPTPTVTWVNPTEKPAEPVEIVEPVEAPWSPAPEATPPERDITALCNELARALYARSQDGGTPMRDLTVLAALAMLDRERAIHADAMESLTEDEQLALEALQQWFLAMEGQLEDREVVLETLSEALLGMQASLRRSPRFGLSVSSLATRVGGFGDVEEWTLRTEEQAYNFIAHSGQEIILYLELEGFDSRLDDKGQWETATSQQLTIYSDRDGIPVWREQWQTATDRAGTKRQDYFTVQKMALPSNLSVGKYQLKVRVRDEQSKAETEATIPFVMTAAALSP